MDPSHAADSPALSTSSDDSIKVGDEAAKDLEETLKQVGAASYVSVHICDLQHGECDMYQKSMCEDETMAVAAIDL